MLEWMLFSSLLILLALAVRALGKNSLSCRARYALWLPVLARLLIPVQLIEAGWGVTVPLPERFTEPSVYVLPVGREEGIPTEHSGEVRDPFAADSFGYSRQSGTAFVKYADKWSAADILRVIWLAGAGLLAAVLLFSNLRFVRRLRRGRVPLDAPCGGMRAYVAEGLASPCLVGVFRPEVYLTPESIRNERTLRHVLAHEETHKRHGDCVWSALRLIALCLHWYHPLVWYAVIVSKRDGELACDEATLIRLGEEERIPYGETLLSMVTAKPGGRELLSFTTAMTAGKRTLRERIESIARHPRTRGAALLLSCAVLLGTALFAFSRPAARTPAGHESTPGDGVSAEEAAPAAEDAGERETLYVTSSYEVEARRIDGGAWSVAIPAEGWTREGGTWTSEAGSTLRIEPSSDAAQAEPRPDTPGRAEAYHPLGDGTGFLVTVRYDPKLQVLSSYLGLEPALLNAMAASFRLKGEAAAPPPTEGRVLALRRRAEAGMTDAERKRLTEQIMSENLWWEHESFYGNIFDRLSDPEDLTWNLLEQAGDIQIGWVHDADGTVDPLIYPGNRQDAASFRKRMTALKESVKSGLLDEDFDRMMALCDRARETRDVDYAVELYHILHDLDYFLLRYGPADVGPRVRDTSTVEKYYGSLRVWSYE